VEISSEIQQFSNFIFQTILKSFQDSKILPGLLLSEIKDPKDILTTPILKSRKKLLEPFISSHNDVFINGLPAPFADLKPEVASSSSSHVGTEILHEIIVLLYSLEELLVQLHELIQTTPSLDEMTTTIMPTTAAETTNLFSSPSPPSYQTYLNGIPSSTRTQTPPKELYLKYLYSIITEKKTVIREDQNPILRTSHDDRLQQISLQILSKLFQIRQESEKILIARNQRVGGFSYFETLYQPKESPLSQPQQSQNQIDDETTTTTPSLPSLEIDYLDPPVLYRIGQVIKHKQFGYRGICTGYDLRPTTDTTNWDGVKELSLGQEQPFYRVRTPPPLSLTELISSMAHLWSGSIGDCRF
jgi:hypothetical protein